MKLEPLAKRYARALFEIVLEKEQLAKVHAELHEFADILARQKRLHTYFYSPEIEKQQKTAMLEGLFKERLSFVFYSFLLLLIRKGRQSLFSQIVREFDRFFDKKNNTVRGSVTTAVTLEKRQLREIEDLLSSSLKATVMLENKVDASILGGIVIQVEGKVFDASLAHQLEIMRRDMQKSKSFVA